MNYMYCTVQYSTVHITAVELHKILLAPLKEVVAQQARRGSWSKPYQVHAVETALANLDADPAHILRWLLKYYCNPP